MRSKLFVPGSRPELFDKAMGCAADALSFDLEDAVAAGSKVQAREQLRDYLSRPRLTDKTLIVRINAQDTAYYADDLRALVNCNIDIVNLPKVESAEQIIRLAEDLQQLEAQCRRTSPLKILANIESPRGLRLASEIAAAHPRVMGLQLGFADLLEPLGIDRHEPRLIQAIQLTVRLAAGEAGIAAYDAAYPSIKDPALYAAEARYARQLGFTGKSCIHPTQIEMANEAFLPSDAEIEKARRIVAAAEQAAADGMGAYQVDGQMVDGPFVVRAEQILLQARQAGLLQH
ncbi:CoA ester lyase [Pseudomonas sp. S31]|uniref:HpcH/HpaI aldolase/citrate lyase family protein n=1 Tax=Pseudomonas sp. S31 TaxID=1564473 RepID=UPI0019130CE0|nr:CoA ester lyase [Pseudomonas sp. S31]MBK5000239.1 CoA ester lyase [Pseudomonas sp. S31]